MAQEVGQPLGIFAVRLVAGDALEALRIDQQDGVALLEQRLHRSPVHPRRFHRYWAYLERAQPIGQGKEIRRHRSAVIVPNVRTSRSTVPSA
jgi:hypothetical protein